MSDRSIRKTWQLTMPAAAAVALMNAGTPVDLELVGNDEGWEAVKIELAIERRWTLVDVSPQYKALHGWPPDSPPEYVEMPREIRINGASFPFANLEALLDACSPSERVKEIRDAVAVLNG